MYDFCYRNGFVFDPETESFIKKDLYVKGGFIAASEEDWDCLLYTSILLTVCPMRFYWRRL